MGITYHPKLYLASSATGARLVVGSANLTLGGLNNNIEASIEVALDFNNPSDRALCESAAGQFATLATAHPNNVFRITTPPEIDGLLRMGRLANEQPIHGMTGTRRQPTDDVPRIRLAVAPLRAPTIPTQPAPARRPQARRRVAAREAAPAWGGVPPLPDTPIAGWEPVWTSKSLTERDLNIPTGATTNRTGSINLDKGLLPAETDHRHYFRDAVFSALTWRPGRQGIEEATARFQLVVKGVYHGDFDLTLSHSTSTTNRTYQQRNAMTRLRWGHAHDFVAHRHLLNRSLSLQRDRTEPTRFLIDID